MQWADRIGHRIKLRDLHVLISVAQTGSMTKAAEGLAISVPVVSKAISDLEHTLGVRLLDRSAQGVEPTPYGRALLDSSVAAFDELRQGVKHIEFLADPRAGEVRVGCPVTMATGFVSGVIDRFCGEVSAHRRSPVGGRISRDLRRSRGAQSRSGDCRNVPAAQRGALECGDSVPRAVRGRRRMSKQMGEAAEREARGADRRALDAAALGHPVRIGRGRGVPREWARGATGSRRHILRSCAQPTGRNRTLPNRSAPFHVEVPSPEREVKILPIDLPTTRRPIGIITLKNRSLSPVARLFIACARELATRSRARTGGY